MLELSMTALSQSPAAKQSPNGRVQTWTLGATARLALAIGLIVGLGALAFQARIVLMLLFAGIVLSTALQPVTVLLHKWGATHAMAVSLLYTLLAALFLVAIGFALPLLVDQTTALVQSAPETYVSLRQQVLASNIPGIPSLGGRLPEAWPEAASMLERLVSHDALLAALGWGGTAARGLLYVMAILLLAFYWSLNEMRTTRAMVMLLAPERRERARELLAAMQEKLGQYVRGQTMVCVIVGGLFFAAAWGLGVPYAIALAFAAMLCEAVPILGPVLGALPAILVAFSVSSNTGLAMSGAALCIHLVEANILIPRVMEKALGLSAVATMLAIVVFGALCGLLGAILAIPLAALVQLILERLLLEPEPVVDHGRDRSALLRRQAQELVHDVRKQLRNRSGEATDETDRWEDEIETIAAALDGQLQAAKGGETPAPAELVR